MNYYLIISITIILIITICLIRKNSETIVYKNIILERGYYVPRIQPAMFSVTRSPMRIKRHH